MGPLWNEMKQVAWLTDIHLNWLTAAQTSTFMAELANVEADAVLLSGDLSEAPELSRHLRLLANASSRPIYFVLGNHDFYFSSIRKVRALTQGVCAEVATLHWLTDQTVVPLTEQTALIGHDGWADARLGDYERSCVSMNDARLIDEFVGLNKQQRLHVLHRLGDEAAEHIGKVLPEALSRFGHVILLTHVPPYREACWYDGHISNDEWLPHFSCKAVGDVLVSIMRDHPEQQLTVLCGHTHGEGECSPIPNIHVLTGGAEYGHPSIQRVLEME